MHRKLHSPSMVSMRHWINTAVMNDIELVCNRSIFVLLTGKWSLAQAHNFEDRMEFFERSLSDCPSPFAIVLFNLFWRRRGCRVYIGSCWSVKDDGSGDDRGYHAIVWYAWWCSDRDDDAYDAGRFHWIVKAICGAMHVDWSTGGRGWSVAVMPCWRRWLHMPLSCYGGRRGGVALVRGVVDPRVGVLIGQHGRSGRSSSRPVHARWSSPVLPHPVPIWYLSRYF